MTAASEVNLLIDRGDRERLVVRGADRAKFLHNYCTNDVKGLKTGRGCEAFVTSPQGRTIGWITILAAEDHHLILADPGGLELVRPHFAKYAVFDDVEFEPLAGASEVHAIGGDLRATLDRVAPGTPTLGLLDHARIEGGATPGLRVVVESPFGRPGHTLIFDAGSRGPLLDRLREGGFPGAVPSDHPAVEAMRIEAGTPIFGRDIMADTLPQEVGRDRQAISFVKGCYLGQETVARIDALGHVNKHLKSLAIVEGDLPRPGDTLTAGGAKAGTLTSVAGSARGAEAGNRPVALAMIRREFAAPGTGLDWSGQDGRKGRAIVAAIP